MHPYLDEPPYYLWSVFGQLLHFAVENEWHQDVFFIGFQHDVAHCHGWSGYCLSQKIKNKTMCSDAAKNVSIQDCKFITGNKKTVKYLFIKIQCSFKIFEARVDHATIVVVT